MPTVPAAAFPGAVDAAQAAPGAAPAAAGVAPMAPGAVAPGGIGGQGGSQSPQSQPGTAEFSAESIVLKALSGEVGSLEDFISPKCKGVLGDIRDGKATEKQIDELKKLFVGIKPVGARNESGTKVLTIRNADNATISFKVKKEGENYKVIEMTVKPGTTKKSR
ncbi:MAG: hypothetical protein ACKV2Q_04605 [Planctomycetaceae bacterium]